MLFKKNKLSELKEKVLNLTAAGEIEQLFSHETCYRRLVEITSEQPNAIALLYLGTQITFAELLQTVDAAAQGFAALGIKYGDAVTFSVLGTPYGIASFYALDKIGAFMHMVNCVSSPEEIRRELSKIPSSFFVGNDVFCSEENRIVLKASGIKTIITISLTDCLPRKLSRDKIFYFLAERKKGIPAKLYDGKELISFQQLLAFGKESNNTVKPADYIPGKRVAVAYTSGSTGNSKACTSTWEGIDSVLWIMSMTEEGRFVRGDVLFATFPLWIYYSLLNMIHEPLCLGVTVALDPLFNPKNLGRRNKQYNFQHWLTIPPYLSKGIESAKRIDCSAWKIVLTGGAALPDELKLRADEFIRLNGGTAQVQQGYGANEMLGAFSYGYYPNATLGCLGKPNIGNRIKILDVETGKPLGPNETGAGYLYSPQRMLEYYGDAEASAYNLVTDENGATWYFSEDLMHVNEQGEIFLDGRIRRIALTMDKNGQPTKIIPERVKKVLDTLPEIASCEVISIPDSKRESVPVAFVVLKEDKMPTESMREHIREFCFSYVPEYMVPVQVFFIDEIPLTPAKKPDYKVLEREAVKRM